MKRQNSEEIGNEKKKFLTKSGSTLKSPKSEETLSKIAPLYHNSSTQLREDNGFKPANSFVTPLLTDAYQITM